jgi:peroxiredoxin-like protein
MPLGANPPGGPLAGARSRFAKDGGMVSMQGFPHYYKVSAAADADGDVNLSGGRLVHIPTAPPEEFGGPGDRWSPETLLVASVASCFILSFRAIARASKFPWLSLTTDLEGTLERHDGMTKFTKFTVNAILRVPELANKERAHRLLEKAEETCLITNSLSGETHLEATIVDAS